MKLRHSKHNTPENILRKILEGTATETGAKFFTALVQNLVQALDVPAAWVSEYTADYQRLRALAFWLDGKLMENVESAVAGTPCEVVLKAGRILHVANQVAGEFPNDPDLADWGVASYLGVPFKDASGVVLGHLAVFDRKPMPESEETLTIMKIFAGRAAAELRRIQAETQIKKREKKLSHLLNTAPDSIVELDSNLNMSLINTEAENAFKIDATGIVGQPFSKFLTAESFQKLKGLIDEMSLSSGLSHKKWVPENLTIFRSDGSTFPAEATISISGEKKQPSYTLILRNIDERLAARAKIRSLSIETDQLKEELRAIIGFDEIIGASKTFLNVLRDVNQVASTEATVLIYGETGTGKELIARTVHTTSQRRNMPLVKVNCAAIPTGLIESELFGYTKGAFTGASQNREGRFALADKGTIFLDEIAELPLELQPKLLRVLQEGEFEPVGSSQTSKVDVRVVAATNRDLEKAVAKEKFRRDLYYRLSVFPILLPPLHERGDDVILLAEAFIHNIAKRMGRRIEPLTAVDIQRLKNYHWPGNVRELQNVIERAIITAQNCILNLDRALPHTADSQEFIGNRPSDNESPILTVAQMKKFEKENLIRALETAGWRISGKNGAAKLLDLPTSTLNSRLKSFGIKRNP